MHMRGALVLACAVVQQAAAFSVPHHSLSRVRYQGTALRPRTAAPLLAAEEEDAPAFNLAGIANQILYGTMTVVSVTGLVEKVPLVMSEGMSGRLFDVVLDVVVFFAAGSAFAKSFGIGGYDYAKLDDLDQASFAREAGEWALAEEVPTRSKDGRYEVATFAGGCFWGTELHFQRLPGVAATCVGYTQGANAKPTYEQVCSGSTGHTEGIQLVYDPALISYEELCKKLLSTVDATKKNRVGNDRGTRVSRPIDSTRALCDEM